MAIVIDEDSAHLALGQGARYAILKDYIFIKRILKIGIGGELLDRYKNKMGSYFEILGELEPAGITPVSESKIEKAKSLLSKITLNANNDIHVLALMKAGRFCLVCTQDGDLIKDVKRKEVLDKPRGCVYSENNPKKAKEMIRCYGHHGDPK